MFSRLKSSFSPSKKPASTGNKDYRKRNRLSKPPTNTSSLSLSSLSLLQPGNRSSTLLALSTSTEERQDQSPLASNDEPREIIGARLMCPDTEDVLEPIPLDTKAWKGAGLVVSDTETQHSTSPTRRSSLILPFSAIFNNTSRLSFISCKEPKDGKGRTPPKIDIRSGSHSREDLTSSIPVRRKSMTQPGVATRIQKDERWCMPAPGTSVSNTHSDSYPTSIILEEASCSDMEALNLEISRSRKPVPPPLVRTETPSDLVFLGGLKLGSLHITNGRVSPAPSDLSRRAKTRSTPNLRTTSSEYGDSDHEEYDLNSRNDNRDASSVRPNVPGVSSRLVSQAPHYQSPLRFSSDDTRPQTNTTVADVNQSLQRRSKPEDTSPANGSADKSTCMAEPPTSLFAMAEHSSFSQSILDPIIKANEFDDNLFEDDVVTPSECESVGNSALHTCYFSSYPTAAQIKQDPSPRKMRPAYTLADSGYSSTSSLRGAEEEADETDTRQIKSVNTLTAAMHTSQSELTIPINRQDRGPGRRPIRPSILKQAGAAGSSLPIFENLHHSTTTVSTVQTTTSMPPTHKARRLNKTGKSARVKAIIVQSNHESFTESIPPVPAEFAANLAIRSQLVPELEHTFENSQYTIESPPTSHVDPVEIRFPSPAASTDGSRAESAAPPQPSISRGSTFRRRSKALKRSSVHCGLNEMSESDALAVIRDFDTVGYSLGRNPYDIAGTNLQPNPRMMVEPSHKTNLQNSTSAAKRPNPINGMDAETAAEIARMRSRTIHERDTLTWAEKRELFNDRGGLPGKNPRPMSFAANTPPLPPLPAGFETNYKRGCAPEIAHPRSQQSVSWRPEYDQSAYNHCTNLQPAQGQSAYERGKSSTSHQDPPVQNHLRGYRPEYDKPREEHRQSWRSDLVEIDFDPGASWSQNHEESDFEGRYEDSSRYENDEARTRWQSSSDRIHRWNQNEAEQDAPPPPPPPHSPRPMLITLENEGTILTANGQAWPARRQSAGEAPRYASNLRPSKEDDGLYPEIPPRITPLKQAYETYARTANDSHWYPGKGNVIPQASHGSHNSQSSFRHPSRPHSQANDDAGSPAEPIHPSRNLAPMSRGPQFGRYSGGFRYGYERGSGFGGSAGTRSVSGIAGANRKGKQLSKDFGVDLSDVPTIAVFKEV